MKYDSSIQFMDKKTAQKIRKYFIMCSIEDIAY